MSRFQAVLLAVLLMASSAIAEPPSFPRVPPTPPEKAEATFQTLHGFRMELIAAEPLVVDPVDMAYDEDGRAYVVEMRDYPYPEEKNAAPTEFPGTVRLLEDENGDGKFDKATVLADTLAWPTSVCCYRGGVFVAAAPDIWYFKDTDGDRKADVRRQVFTGFSRYNVQAIMNSLRWGLDNKIYGAAAGNGGAIRHAERPDDPLIQLSRRDFRFAAVTEKLEPIAGGERFGACFDDWGNRFLCNIRNPVQHVVLPLEYVQRNPHLVVPSLIHDCAESGDQLRVFRLSPPEPWRLFRAQRWSLEGVNYPRSELIGAGFWTSSSGVCVYRGAAYPEPFRGNVFIGEVAGNLVHRQILERDGVTFKSRRADENTEFIRSTDNWFRPVNFVNAPDGTLHVLDMYRETIEHPWSIPDDIKAQLDLSSGNDRGRLYRLSPPDFTPRKPPKLSTATTAELVAHLASPHGWWRETAQRLLFERQDKAAVEPLRKLLETSLSPMTRIHVLYALDGLQSLGGDEVRKHLRDPAAEVVRHALILAEPRAKGDRQLVASMVARARHPDAGVRMQAALSLGNLDHEAARLAGLLNIAARDGDDSWTRTAVLSAAAPDADELAAALARRKDRNAETVGRSVLVRQIAAIAAARGEASAIQGLLHIVAGRERGESEEMGAALLAGVGQGLAQRKQTLADSFVDLPDSDRQHIHQFMKAVAARAGDASLPASKRLPAIELLRWFPWSDARQTLWSALRPAEPSDIQRAAIQVLSAFSEPEVDDELIRHWKQLPPPLREEAVGLLLSRPIWHEALIAALEAGDIPVGQVAIPHRARMAALPDKALAERAKAVLAAVALGPRKEVIDRYQPSLALKADAARGKLVYRRECANCHKLEGEGHDVGPSLATVQHRSPQEILIHVLDPSREVSPQFLDYAVRTTDGRVVTGMIAAETDAGLTLRRAEKQEESILRSEIDEITSSGKSLMPDGLEQKIKPEEMADLIDYLRQPLTAASASPP